MEIKVKRILLVALVLCSLIESGFVKAESQYRKDQFVFRSDSSQSEHPVSLGFDGKIYREKMRKTFDEIQKEKIPITNEEKFVIDYIAANRKGDKEEMLSFWRPSERERVKNLMDDKEAYDRNLALFKNINSSKFSAIILYGKYILLFVEHDLQGLGAYIKFYPIVKDGGHLYITNALVGDYFFDHFAQQLADYLKMSKAYEQ